MRDSTMTWSVFSSSRAKDKRGPVFLKKPPHPQTQIHTPGRSGWAKQQKGGGRGENVEQCRGDEGDMGQTGRKEEI